MKKCLVLLLVMFSFHAFSQEMPTEEDSEIEALESEAVVEPEKPTPRRSAQPAEKRKFRIGLAAYYSLADKFESSGSLTTQGTVVSYSGEDKTNGAAGVALSVISGADQPIGFEGGISYEFDRTVDSFTLSTSGANFSGNYTGSKPKVKLMSVFGNARFQVNSAVYFLAGLNITKVSLANSELSVSTGYGGQAGAGFQVTRDLGLEAQYRMIQAKASSAGILSNGKSYTQDIDRLEFNGLSFLVKYMF